MENGHKQEVGKSNRVYTARINNVLGVSIRLTIHTSIHMQYTLCNVYTVHCIDQICKYDYTYILTCKKVTDHKSFPNNIIRINSANARSYAGGKIIFSALVIEIQLHGTF